MNIAFLCIIIACLMPILFAGIAKFGGMASGKPLDNHNPRTYLASLNGWPQRAQAAQLNSWEALPIFIAAILMASITQVPQATINGWALAFIVIRILYGACYIFNLATLRTLVWSAGLFACLRLMIAAL